MLNHYQHNINLKQTPFMYISTPIKSCLMEPRRHKENKLQRDIFRLYSGHLPTSFQKVASSLGMQLWYSTEFTLEETGFPMFFQNIAQIK